ncbi:hypothetical protein L1887_21287 [Cichorium endivia]|nr:hypothetical protein L1887_21287 [Cichorium endivia]
MLVVGGDAIAVVVMQGRINVVVLQSRGVECRRNYGTTPLNKDAVTHQIRYLPLNHVYRHTLQKPNPVAKYRLFTLFPRSFTFSTAFEIVSPKGKEL